ncbi:hypothetical protein PanWU01x14_097460 [Parasponia andersonii]|uniref:Uncharacterized protein n=1 Tax=Parasponia andersonii TaxID=3476 RepID=A0A2P5D4I2_PARAD|nr:hypothetical protein PanWU01x14_097460 [Parasponia andersonii]
MNRKKKDSEAQVEELLKAVEDDMLLNLSLNSHISRVSPDYLDSDLDRRFRALKSRPSNSPNPKPNHSPSPPADRPSEQTLDPQPDPELTAVLGDDLSDRFAKLRASLPQPPSASISGSAKTLMEGLDRDGDEEQDEDDEVEKLIRWAKDAARLDPSPPSDDDDDDDHQDKGNHPQK